MKETTKKYPFKFLNSYNKEDKKIFFGREKEVEALYKMVFETNMMLIYGASGTGKTSIIQCGLANKFKPSQWQDLYIRRGDNMNNSLLEVIEKATAQSQNVEENTDELDWLDDLIDADIDHEIKENSETPTVTNPLSKAEKISSKLQQLYLANFKPIYLIFDQFEELYTLGKTKEQTEFIEIIQHLVEVKLPVKIILSMREEYFGRLYELEKAVPQLREKRLRLEPMAVPLAKKVITKAIVTNSNSCISLEEGQEETITKAIVDNIRENDINIKLPYLQVYIDRLHESARIDKNNYNESTILTLDAIHKQGEIKEVLKNFIEKQSKKVYTALTLQPSFRHLPQNIVWTILSPFATLKGTKIPIKEQDLGKIAQDEAIQSHFKNHKTALEFVKECTHQLGKHRILRYRGDDKAYEVLHDTLAKEIAEKRSEEQKAILRVKRLIESQTIQGSARELLTERQLNYIEPTLEKLKLSPIEEELIKESYKAVTQKNADKEAKQKAKLQQARRFSLIAGSIAILAIIASIFAFTQYKAAKNQKEKAEIQKKKAQFSLIQSYKIEQERYKSEIGIIQQNVETLKNHGATDTTDVIHLENERIKTFTNRINALEDSIKILK